ncbi:MAG: dodecin family protein [Vulcanimicrobiaceae bacterium]
MAMLKVIEVLAQSEDSWEDAAREAIRHASETVRGIRSIYIKNFEAEVEDDEVTMFRINAKISFLLESEEADEDEDEDEEEEEEEEE